MTLTKDSTPEEVRAAWVEALRSGEYQQGQDALHKVTGNGSLFCCLGVLCDLAVKAGITAAKPYEDVPADKRFWMVSGDQILYREGSSPDDELWRGDVLPKEVARWADVDPEGTLANVQEVVARYEGIEPMHVAVESLVGMNDDACASFDEIADAIERGWLISFSRIEGGHSGTP